MRSGERGDCERRVRVGVGVGVGTLAGERRVGGAGGSFGPFDAFEPFVSRF
jgi:hypothetical protein